MTWAQPWPRFVNASPLKSRRPGQSTTTKLTRKYGRLARRGRYPNDPRHLGPDQLGKALESSLRRIRSIASFKDSLCRDDDPQAAAAFPPITARVVESYSGFGKRSVLLLQAHVKVLRTNAQHHSAFVLNPSLLSAGDRDNRADRNIGSQPFSDRIAGLTLFRRV